MHWVRVSHPQKGVCHNYNSLPTNHSIRVHLIYYYLIYYILSICIEFPQDIISSGFLVEGREGPESHKPIIFWGVCKMSCIHNVMLNSFYWYDVCELYIQVYIKLYFTLQLLCQYKLWYLILIYIFVSYFDQDCLSRTMINISVPLLFIFERNNCSELASDMGIFNCQSNSPLQT